MRARLYERQFGGVAWRLAVAAQVPLLLATMWPRLAGSAVEQWPGAFADGLMSISIFSVFLGVLTIAVGSPLYLFYRRLGWTSPVLFVAGAALVVGVLYLLPEFGARTGSDFSYSTGDCEAVIHNVRTACGWGMFYEGLWYNVGYGALAGLVFWALLLKPAKRAETMAGG